MITRRGLIACALLAACNEPAAPPRLARQQQALSGLPVFHRELRTLTRSDGSIVMQTGTPLDPRMRRAVPHFVDDESGAIRRAAGTARVASARARKFWYPLGDQLIAAWVVEAYTSELLSTTGDLVRTVIAADGHIIARESLVADAFTYTVFAETTGEKHPFDGPTQDATPHPTGVPDGSYPAYVSPQAVSVDALNEAGDPWLAADATVSSGNNVDAYVDLYAPTGLTDGDFRASAVGTTFSNVYDTAQGPLATLQQQHASITSLFYVLNWLHDFWYDAGFDEVAGNAQASNYGRGGVDGDVLLAEAQDNAFGGSRNNANMSTPDDGMSPRMQVFLWNGKDTRTLSLAPSGRTPVIGAATYGPTTFTLTADVVLGQDGLGASMTDGCTPFTNTVTGMFVLVDRGNCTFKTKTLNAQNAGAAGLIVANNVFGDSPPILGEDSNITTAITIPSISITREEGGTIKTELGAGTVTATAHRDVAPELDGALDSTLIAHEFGHYLHHRLSFCSDAMCRALSEGWGDFSALLLLARPGDNLRGAFPFSVYTTQGYPGDPGYFGIRRAPYSVDTSINSLSFRHMADGEPLPTTHPFHPSGNNAESHNAGEVWTAALWEAYVALQDAGAQQGLTFDQVRRRMAEYVVTGLSLTPSEASPLQTRDALLAAALASHPGDEDVMIQAFARRGFGSCAVAPPEDSIDFIGLVESTVIAGNAQLASLTVEDGCDNDGVIDTGETAHVKVRIVNQGHAPLTDLTFTITSQISGLTVVTPPSQLARLDTFATTDVDVEVALAAGIGDELAGDLALEVTAAGGCTTTVAIPVAARLNIDDVGDSSTTDSFDTAGSVWEPWVAAWRHIRETALDGVWHGDDLPIGSDTRLTSPSLVASADEPMTISFAHRYSFETGSGTTWDGGVIEYSVDNGVTWADVSALAPIAYSGTISGESGNPLADRAGFVGQNAAWPDYETVTLDLGSALEGQVFRLRFRIGTDGGTGAPGWDIDDVAFTGILGTPFPSQRADDGACSPPAVADPIISGGGGCQSGGAPGGGLALGVLGLLARRRRAARAATARRAS